MKCRECGAPPAMKIKVTRLHTSLISVPGTRATIELKARPFTIFACQKHLPTALVFLS